MKEHLRRNALALGLPYGERTMTYNSRIAQELGLWAQERGKGRQFHDAAFRAYFVRGENIAEKEVLLKIADSSGLNLDEAGHIITDRTYSDHVDRDWQRARERGITAAPTFVIGDDMLVGAQEYRSLASFAAGHGASKA